MLKQNFKNHRSWDRRAKTLRALRSGGCGQGVENDLPRDDAGHSWALERQRRDGEFRVDGRRRGARVGVAGPVLARHKAGEASRREGVLEGGEGQAEEAAPGRVRPAVRPGWPTS